MSFARGLWRRISSSSTGGGHSPPGASRAPQAGESEPPSSVPSAGSPSGPGPCGGPAELAASIESFDSDRAEPMPPDIPPCPDDASGPADLDRGRIDHGRTLPSSDLAPVLLNWGITRFRVTRKLGGSSGAAWLIDAPSGLHVLRKLLDHSASATASRARVIGTSQEYLHYQVMAIRHLSSSAFPYEVPVLLKPSDSSSPCVGEGGTAWILYRFIEGDRHHQPSAASHANEIGALVGHFSRALATLHLGTLEGRYVLKLFDIPNTTRRLSASARRLSARRDLARIRSALLENIDNMLDAYTAIPASEIAAVSTLARTTIYNDWHPWNIVNRSGKIHGLIDFDGVVEAPRIVDFQNALTYALASEEFRPRHELVSAFASGYCRVLPMSSTERGLIYPVMLDRIAWMVANLVEDVCGEARNQGEGITIREGLAIRLIRLFVWLRNHRDRITGDLRVE